MYKISVISLAFILAVDCSTLHAQDPDDILVQVLNNRLTTGALKLPANDWTLGQRSFSSEFDGFYAVNNPGWNAFGVGSDDLPPGSEALPFETALEWDFLPMKIDNSAANLFYWNGSGSVQFGALPGPSYEFSLQAMSNNFVPTSAIAALVPGGVFWETDDIGSLHEHRLWFLDDGAPGTDPVDGIYLASIRTRMTGLDRSMPFYILFGTPGSTSTALSDAQDWVDNRLDELAPDFSADFDGDLNVDSDDLADWTTGYGSTGSAALQIAGDADFNGRVDGLDFLQWQLQRGSNLVGFSGTTTAPLSGIATVPEPQTMSLVGMLILCRPRIRSKVGHGPLP